jgi:hypothetical protein
MSNPWTELHRRMRPVHEAWQAAVADLTLEQVNHHERAGVLPIAFSLMHLVTTEDRAVSERFFAEPMLWEAGSWAERVGVTVPSVRRGTPIEVAEQLRFADLDAWRTYQTAVFGRTSAALLAAEPVRWTEVTMEAVPPSMQGGFLHLLVGEGPVTLGDYAEVVLYHHAIRHLGELEHARSLVGLTGVGG